MPPLADAILALGVRRRAQAGEVLLAEGAVPDRVLVLIDGRVKVTARAAHGRTAVLALRGPGAVLGETGALTGGPRTATVTALEAVTYAAVHAGRLRGAVAADMALALDVIAILGARLAEADRRHGEGLSTGATSRVARRLDAVEAPDVPLTQAEVAGLAGTSLESTAKALRTLREAGAITTGRGRLVIEDRDALRRVGSGHG